MPPAARYDYAGWVNTASMDSGQGAAKPNSLHHMSLKFDLYISLLIASNPKAHNAITSTASKSKAWAFRVKSNRSDIRIELQAPVPLLAEELVAGLYKKHEGDLIILDFSKTFDRVPHQFGLLLNNGGGTYNWVISFLSDRTQQVLVEGAISDSMPAISGVPQGTTICPLLFLLLRNDLTDCV